MSKTSQSYYTDGLRAMLRLSETLSRVDGFEQAYACGLNAVHELLQPDSAFVLMPEPGDALAERTDMLRPGTPTDVSIRLAYGGEHFGFFLLHYDGPRQVTEEEVLLVETMASQVSAGVALSLHRNRLKQALDEARARNHHKDEFISMVAHELQGPLMTILGAVSILRSRAHQNPAGAVDMIERNARAQAKIISDLLDLARIETGKIDLEVNDVDIVPLLEEVVQEKRATMPARSVSVEFWPERESIVVRGDSQRLRQVFANLLSNSVRFASPAGEARVRAAIAGEIAEIRFIDNGVGIAPEFLPCVFERFSQQHRSAPGWQSGGLGLGLFIVKKFVEMHNGAVHAESEGIGRGAVFVVTLPCAGRQTPITGAS